MINLIWKILIGLFILDVIKKRMEPAPKVLASQANTTNSNIEKDIKKEEEIEDIDTRLDEDIEEDEEADEEEKQVDEESEDEQDDEDENVAKKNDENKDEEDEVEEIKKKSKNKHKTTKKSQKTKAKKKKKGPKTIILIRYDKATYQKYLDQFKIDMLGNFTNIDVVDEPYPLPPIKSTLSKVTTVTQISVSALLFGGTKLKGYLTFIPGGVFDFIEKNKWSVIIGNFLFHQVVNQYLKSSGAFEISVGGVEIWSKLQKKTLPKIKDIAKIFIEKGIDVNYK